MELMDKMKTYYSLRDQIQTGDGILWKTDNLLGKTIRLWTEFNHGSLVVRLDKYKELEHRVFMVEALEHGLDLTLLSDQLQDYKGEVWWLPIGMNGVQKAKSRSHALLECARRTKDKKKKRYDYESLFKNMIGRISMDARNYFCTEFMWFNWIDAEIAPVTKKAPRPGDLPKWLKIEPIKIYP